MITYKKEHLVISIYELSPQERRDWLMKAIAAAVRWNAHADRTNADDENLVVLAQLMEELIDIDRSIVE